MEDALKEIGDGVNKTSYAKFLTGEIWDSRMKDIDINKVTRKLEDYVLETCVRSSYGSNCDGKTHISTTIVPFSATKCLLFQYVNTQHVASARIWIKSSIFPDGIRPPHDHQFIFNTVFPQQVSRLSSAIWGWPPRNNASDTYVMSFSLSRIEIIKRRRKRGNNCYDWNRYDAIVQENILSEVGCRPFNLTSMLKFPMCSTAEQMKQIRQKYWAVFSENGVPPCSEIQSLQIKYDEYDTNSVSENQWSRDLKTNFSTIDGWFGVRVEFRTNTFKEIKQNRAYPVQSLVGNAGGYVGLLVGYTVADVAILCGIVCKWFSKWFVGARPGRENSSRHSWSSPLKAININFERRANNQNIQDIF